MITKEDWAEGFSLLLEDQEAVPGLWKKRTLSQMKTWFSDQAAADAILGVEDPVIYEYQEIGAPEHPGDVAFGISRVFPGKVGREFYMTKGHFHNISDTAEVYYGLKGHGLLLIEREDGVWKTLPLEPGVASYVPRGFAHRSINTGSEPLEFFFAFRADAGHNYGRIEISGFSHIVTDLNHTHDMNRIERVKKYERLFDEVITSPDPEKLRQLEAYYTSGEWREDYEADERGELPPGLKRGILSQDALYNLLESLSPD